MFHTPGQVELNNSETFYPIYSDWLSSKSFLLAPFCFLQFALNTFGKGPGKVTNQNKTELNVRCHNNI